MKIEDGTEYQMEKFSYSVEIFFNTFKSKYGWYSKKTAVATSRVLQIVITSHTNQGIISLQSRPSFRLNEHFSFSTRVGWKLLMYLGNPIGKLFCIWHSCREKYESIIFQTLHKVFTEGCSVERECVCGKMREEMHAFGRNGHR